MRTHLLRENFLNLIW